MAGTDTGDSNLGEAENDNSNVYSNAQSNGNDDIELTEEVNIPRKNKNKNIRARKTSKSTVSKAKARAKPKPKSKTSTNPKRKNRNSSVTKSSEIIYISTSSEDEEAQEVQVVVEIERQPEIEAETQPEVQPQVVEQAGPAGKPDLGGEEAGSAGKSGIEEEIDPPEIEIEEVPKSVSDGSPAIIEEKMDDEDQSSSGDEEYIPRKVFKIRDGFRGFIDITTGEIERILQQLFDIEEIEVIQMQVLADQERGEFNSPARKRRRRNDSDESTDSSSPALSLCSQISVISYTKRSRTGSPASRGSRKSNIDLTNPKYLLPFEYGWKREVVTRGITSREDGISKDVYYFHPGGKKLRSLREVSERLTAGLTSDNFTFYKEPLGIDPQFETVRNARSMGHSPSDSSTPRATPVRRTQAQRSPRRPSTTSPKEQAGGPGTRSSQRATQDTASSPFAPPPPARREKIVLRFNKGTPKIALKRPASAVNGDQLSTAVPKVEGPKPHPNAPAGPRRKITPRKKFAKPQTAYEGSEFGSVTPFRSPSGRSSNESLSWSHLDEKSTIQEGEQDYCTIRCTNAMGLIPTLQCSICLYIYHPDCCDMDHITSVFASITYICENCQAKSSDSKGRGLVKNITPAVVTCEQSPPIISPKPIHPLVMSPVTPSAPLASRIPQIRPRPPSSSSVGGLTTWLPPTNRILRSSRIPTTIHHRPERALSPPQSIVNLNYRRYIVVPKRSVFSFAPNRNSSPTKAEYNPSATVIMPTPTSTIIEGPPLKNNPFIRTTGTGPGMFLFPFNMGVNPYAGSNSRYLFANPIAALTAAQRSSQPDFPIGCGTLDYFANIKNKVSKRSTAEGVDESMQKFMRNICIGYTALLNVFQYLKVQELLRAGRVCRLWRDIAGHSSLWRTVRMKNSQVSDWKGFTDSLIRHETKFLDLRKMLVSLDETEEMWTTFAKYISNVTSLEGLEMCRCSVKVMEQMINSCPQLQIFNAQMIGVKEHMTCQKLKIETITQMKQLKEIRLKSCYGLNLVGSFGSFAELTGTLTVFSLTSIRNLASLDVYQLAKLGNLEALELGECTDLPEDFPTVVIAKLEKLKRIRFEKGPSKCTLNEMLEVMKNLKELVQLELINFDIRPGFDEALAACTNIKRLLLIPTYVTQSATTNNIVLSGAFKLWQSLTHFVWVVTMELLKVTELFVDQCEMTGGVKGSGTSVPVLKPVPKPEVGSSSADESPKKPEENLTGTKGTTPITVIPIDQLYELVKGALPNTRVKLLKIPFQNTWRQSIAEGSV